MATTEVRRRDNRGLWIALAVIAVLAVLAILFLSANNRSETAALDAATTDVAMAEVGDADLAGAGAAATDAAQDAAASASAAAAAARDAAADAASDTTAAAEDRLSVDVGPDGTTVSGTATTD